jgi:biotin carboxyl carrier protein
MMRTFRSRWRAAAIPETGMPDIKIVTEVAGRVCALPVEIGASLSDGDDIAFVEAMKMEIPVASPAAGKLKSILVSLDDMVAEGRRFNQAWHCLFVYIFGAGHAPVN